jgi:DNA-binding GntR family transcriptional regulator
MVNYTTATPVYRTKEESIYEALRQAILRGELKPGEKLVLDRLAADLKVSPLPVRSALQRLRTEGLVQITPYSGTVVSEISWETIDEIFTLLEHLEAMACQVIAHKASTLDFGPLTRLVEEMDQALERKDPEAYSELNSRFHRTIAEMTGLHLLIEFTARTLDNWDRLRRFYLDKVFSPRIPVAQEEHRQILVCLQAGDAAKLGALVALHNRGALEDYRKLR